MGTVRPAEVCVNINATRDESRRAPAQYFTQVSSVNDIEEVWVY
jgi:hypothetical protein